jgi:RNA polymerase sigma factor for flagellar operon FliA
MTTAHAISMDDLRIPMRVLRKHYPIIRAGHRNYQDLIGAGNLGLVKASQRFREDGGASWESYAWTRVRGEIGDHLRRHDHLGRHVRARVNAGTLQDIPEAGELPDDNIEDRCQEDEFARADVRVMVDAAVRGLPPRERHVIREVFWFGRTLEAAGADQGVTESRACQIKAEAFQRLRPLLRDLREVA